jgi:RNA polymerase-binding transcription factor DksA
MDITESEVRRRLERELVAVARRLRELGGPEAVAELRDTSGADAVLDEGDEVSVDHAQHLSLATRERLTGRLRRLQSALDRLERGEYGRCVDCGRPIEPARLRALPEVETCLACQERRARSGRPDAAA